MKKIMIVLFILIVCLPMLLAFYWASAFASQKIEAMMRERAENRFRVAEALLMQKIGEVRLKAGIITQQRNIRTAVETGDLIELIDLLNSMLKDLGLSTLAAGAEIYAADQQLLVAEPRNPSLTADIGLIKSGLGGNLAEKIYFKDQRLIFGAAVPIYCQNNSNPAATLILYLVVDENMVDSIRAVVDAEIVLFSQINNTVNLLTSTLVDNNRRVFPVITDPGSGIGEVGAAGRRFMVRSGSFLCENGRFTLTVALEKRELTEILNSLRDVFFKTGLVAILFALLVAIAFSGILIRPVQSLVDVARNFGAGNLEASADVSSFVPELQFLGETFSSMTRQIRNKIDEIEAARQALDKKVFDLSVRNLINQAIINKSEDSVLKELLEIVSEMMRTRRSSMLLLNEVTGELSLKLAVIKDEHGKRIEQDDSHTTFAPGEGLAGCAARQGRGIFSNDPFNDPRFKQSGRVIRNLVAVPLFDEGRVIGVINVSDRAEDFTEEDTQLLQGVADQIAIALQKTRLYELAITDGLTGLFIHRYFQMRLESEIARANRSSEKLALIIFDIDHFKKFNDTYGHQVGDRVIRLVADRVRKNIREGIDIAARYGGEEFTVIMPDTDLKGALAFAERLRQSIEQSSIDHDGSQLRVTVSLGCAIFPDHAQTRETLICNSDSALYKSKENGRNRSTPFEK